MIPDPLGRVLEATGYLLNGEPAARTVSVAKSDTHVITPSDVHTRLPSFRPEAWWRSNPEAGPWSGSADLKVYFKFVQEPEAAPVAEWQREVWNQGFSPLLWLIFSRKDRALQRIRPSSESAPRHAESYQPFPPPGLRPDKARRPCRAFGDGNRRVLAPSSTCESQDRRRQPAVA